MAGDTMSQVIVMQVEDFKRVVNESVRSAVREELKTISIAPEVMREKEAAKYLGLSANTLRQYRVQGIGPAYSKTGSVITYAKADLDYYLKKAKVKTY